MKISCEKYILQSACTIASRATASKSPIPALEGLLLQAGIDLRVTGYDLKKGIYTEHRGGHRRAGQHRSRRALLRRDDPQTAGRHRHHQLGLEQ